MNTQSREPQAPDGARLERAVVLQLLRDDHDQSWSRAELASELGADAPAVQEALSRLQREGVVSLSDDQITASPAARRLDALELISV
jgi:Mn-dependent DtxR family transcriptional regulator